MTTIWHNPRCSKSRQTLDLIRERGVEPTVIAYLKESPEQEEIRRVLGMLGIGARDLMRQKEDTYRTLDLAKVEDEEELINAMFYHPILIERPIVIHEEKAAIGRPPENVLSIL